MLFATELWCLAFLMWNSLDISGAPPVSRRPMGRPFEPRCHIRPFAHMLARELPHAARTADMSPSLAGHVDLYGFNGAGSCRRAIPQED